MNFNKITVLTLFFTLSISCLEVSFLRGKRRNGIRGTSNEMTGFGSKKQRRQHHFSSSKPAPQDHESCLPPPYYSRILSQEPGSAPVQPTKSNSSPCPNSRGFKESSSNTLPCFLYPERKFCCFPCQLSCYSSCDPFQLSCFSSCPRNKFHSCSYIQQCIFCPGCAPEPITDRFLHLHKLGLCGAGSRNTYFCDTAFKTAFNSSHSQSVLVLAIVYTVLQDKSRFLGCLHPQKWVELPHTFWPNQICSSISPSASMPTCGPLKLWDCLTILLGFLPHSSGSLSLLSSPGASILNHQLK